MQTLHKSCEEILSLEKKFEGSLEFPPPKLPEFYDIDKRVHIGLEIFEELLSELDEKLSSNLKLPQKKTLENLRSFVFLQVYTALDLI